MTLSIELLPAPLGPMMARISCSRTSRLIPVSAFTPPKEREILSSSSTTSPALRAALIWRAHPSCGFPRGARGKDIRFRDPKVGRNHAAAAILELDQRLDVLHVPVRIQRFDQHAILFGNEVAAHLARARQLVVVRIELLVQDDETVHLRRSERPLACELG